MNTTHTKEHTEPKEKPKASQLLETISLRDYFAAKAMQGILTDPEIVMGATEIANLSYKYADAMLKAREQ